MNFSAVCKHELVRDLASPFGLPLDVQPPVGRTSWSGDGIAANEEGIIMKKGWS